MNTPTSPDEPSVGPDPDELAAETPTADDHAEDDDAGVIPGDDADA